MRENATDQLYGHYIPCSHLAMLVTFAELSGIAMQPLLKKQALNLEIINTPGARIPAPQYAQVMLDIDGQTNEDDFWFRFGKQLDFPAFEVLGQVMLCCDSLHQAMHLLAKYYPLLSCGSELRCVDEENALYLYIYRQGGVESRASLIRSELLLSVIFKCILESLIDGGGNISFEFDYRKPAYSNLYSQYLNNNCTFSAPQSRLVIPSEYLQSTGLRPNAVMLQILLKQCDQLLEPLQNKQSICAQVRTAIAAIPGSYPTAKDVAKKTGLSTRTLSRRLKEQGTSFQRLMNEVKTQRASNYLKTTQMSIEEIATQLGFSDSANFRSAFVSWTGILPSEYRRTKL
jgi:AraC-like DNA-binding protein